MTKEEMQERIEAHFRPIVGLEKAQVLLNEPGHSRVAVTLDEGMMSYRGHTHGGFLCTVCDAVFGINTFRYGVENVTVDANFQFIRPSFVGDTLLFDCTALHRGRSTIVQEVRVTNQDDRLVMVARATMLPLSEFPVEEG